jgi:hypothetical protein
MFANAPAWSALFLGLFSLAAGIGAWRRPGLWQQMIEEIRQSPAIQMVMGMAELMLGFAVYLTNSWLAGDWLACAMKALGGLMAIEALVIIALADSYFAFWLRLFGTIPRWMVPVTLIFGIALCAVALPRFA